MVASKAVFWSVFFLFEFCMLPDSFVGKFEDLVLLQH